MNLVRINKNVSIMNYSLQTYIVVKVDKAFLTFFPPEDPEFNLLSLSTEKQTYQRLFYGHQMCYL